MLCLLFVGRGKKKKWLGGFFPRAGHALLAVLQDFCAGYFRERFLLYAWASLGCISPICAGMTDMNHYSLTLVEMGLAGLEPQSS
jgi:hypothetical protein